MYIIVIGGGRVGYYLTRALLDEGHEALVIEKNSTVCEGINEELGSVCLLGDGCEVATLAEAGTDRADMLIAVTGDDEDNLVSCQVAKQRFGVKRTISRMSNPKNEVLFKKLGVDVTISATNLIMENIETEVPTHILTHLLTLSEQGLEIFEVRVPPKSSTVGKAVSQLVLPHGTVLSLVLREGGRPFVPTADTVIQSGDRIIALTPTESEEALRAVLRGADPSPNSDSSTTAILLLTVDVAAILLYSS